jgi:hypothetical protein
VASALTNAILVKWDAAEDSFGYYVYRKEVNADGPIDSTLVLRSGSTVITTTSPKGVPYYFDTGIAKGKKYQYGIASQSYKNGNDVVAKSEVVWQEVENNAFVEANVSDPGEVSITAPKYTIVRINSTPAGSNTGVDDKDFAETFLLTFTGLEPGITYGFQVAYENDNSTTPTWRDPTTGVAGSYTIPGGYTLGSNSTPSIGTYVDDDNKIIFNTTVLSGANNAGSDNAYQYYGFRVMVTYALPGTTGGNVVLYPSNAGYYIKTPSPTAALETSSTIGVSP